MTSGFDGRPLVISITPERPSCEQLGFVEQRVLADDVRLAALAPFRPDVIGHDIAPAVGAEIGLGLDERARVGDDIDDA